MEGTTGKKVDPVVCIQGLTELIRRFGKEMTHKEKASIYGSLYFIIKNVNEENPGWWESEKENEKGTAESDT